MMINKPVDMGDDGPVGATERFGVERLEHRLMMMQQAHEEMELVNKIVKTKSESEWDDELSALGYDKYEIWNIKHPMIGDGPGIPQFILADSDERMRELRGRITAIKDAKAKGLVVYETNFFRVEENSETKKINIFFDIEQTGKYREIVESHGFKWIPSQECWQRTWDSTARDAVSQLEKDYGEAMKTPFESEE